MFILTGNTMWTVPLAHSRFGFLVDYITEGRILGKDVAEQFPDGKVGIIAQNDDFRKEGEKGSGRVSKRTGTPARSLWSTTTKRRTT
jgi:hypothetical protein